MKKRLSHFPYNERSRPGWTPSTSLQKPLSPIRSTMKTVTYVPGTFVTLVPGPYRGCKFGETKTSKKAPLEQATRRTDRRIYFREDLKRRRRGMQSQAVPRTRRRISHRQDFHAGSENTSLRRPI